jgi:hypothetical protein
MNWFLIRDPEHYDVFEGQARITNTVQDNEKLTQGTVSNKVFTKQSSRPINLMCLVVLLLAEHHNTIQFLFIYVPT